MAKKFMCVCLGILALMVAFHLGAQFGQAGYVDHSTSGVVGFDHVYGKNCLLDDGSVWEWSQEFGWRQSAVKTVPVPVSEIKFWSQDYLVTFSNEMWRLEGGGSWLNYGSPPGAALAQPTTWSQIKAEFGE